MYIHICTHIMYNRWTYFEGHGKSFTYAMHEFVDRFGFLTLLPGRVRSLVPRHLHGGGWSCAVRKTCRESMVKKGNTYQESQC